MFSHLLKMSVLVEEDERETFGGNLVIDVTFLRGFQRAPESAHSIPSIYFSLISRQAR